MLPAAFQVPGVGACTQTCEHPYAAAANPLGVLTLLRREGFEETDVLHTLRINPHCECCSNTGKGAHVR